MSESGLPAPKRNREPQKRVHQPWAPTADTRPGTAADAHGAEKSTHTSEPRDLGGTAGEGVNPATTALAAFIQFHPSMTFFCWLADIQYGSCGREAKVRMLRKDSAHLYQVCVILDLTVTMIAVTAIMVIAGLVAYKSLR